MLKLFYITNNPEVAKAAENAGTDRIFVDMEYIGKEIRQPNMNTVKNRHTVNDVKALRRVLTKAELLVRVNPIYENSENEINDVINAGADVIMLPMWKSADEVKAFIDFVSGRAKTVLLLETDEAYRCLDEVLTLDGIDEIHIGLNDLHLSQGKRFMFELLIDGTVDSIAEKIKKTKIPFGIGGIGAVGTDVPLPAERILAEHYRLGSSMAILSRSFCSIDSFQSIEEFAAEFEKRLLANREYEIMLSAADDEFFKKSHKQTEEIIKGIVSK